MSLIRYEPWGVMNRLHRDLDRLLESRFGSDETQGAVTDWVPAVDIREEDEHFVLHADVPGVDPKDIEITMQDGVLTLRGTREEVKEEERQGYRRVERLSGQFFRRFNLPDTADAESITARSANGVLEVKIPKHAKVQPRRIAVKSD
ncbi:MAG: Hsp20/alpha crystallin family protein [Gammaproteobacteria bacterium]|nr:Hsp20/alpha crystallin family protein [Gammaproteobacteria bacterium]